MPNTAASTSPTPSQSQKRYGGVPRKRNVTSRDRNGCVTCRKRHLRCDKTHPKCNNCSKMNRVCEGYAKRISFCDETLSVTQKAQGMPSANPRVRPTKTTLVETRASPKDAIATIPEMIEDVCALQDQTIETISPNSDEPGIFDGEEWMFQDWDLASWSPVDQDAVYPCASSSLPLDANSLSELSIQLHPSSINLGQIPTIAQPLSMHSALGYRFMSFPQDEKYIMRLQSNQVEGLEPILPIADVLMDETVMTSHCWSAALAVSAITASKFSSTTAECMSHASHHYISAMQNLRKAFPPDSLSSMQVSNCTSGLLSWILTHLLLANFDLYRGNLSSWRRHLRTSGRIFSKWHQSILHDRRGRLLASTFARMALLVELQNSDLSLTKVQDMNPGVATHLESMMEGSDSSRDRLLLLIRDVTKTELKFRHRPELQEKWARKMQLIDQKLMDWQKRLPVSELPVDTGIAESVKFQPDPGSTIPPLEVRPLSFPNATNPITSAVNYAHFLCSRMRANTRYTPNGGKSTPPNTDSTVFFICRIAAGLSPRGCAKHNAFGHGIMPALVGSYRWSSDLRIRHWINSWLRAYEDQSCREGLWNVRQARRLVSFLEDESRRRTLTSGCWGIVAARIEDENDPTCDDLSSIEEPYSFFNGNTGEDEKGAPFRVVVHSRCPTGWETDHFIIA
ncbi:unnamed protein product [Clonostachys solani]|uniref:Zn(2)-C6 fungal-type domain-containing protein n=1 Tax=Clonostachys solani TaxID=160281 RepID=A0A9P0EIJ6_9HYPO|nr:unnamed protein product [Clonostachys solani]